MEDPGRKDVTTKIRVRLFFPWSLSREERWLSKMAARGLMFQSVSGGVYTFVSGGKRALRFALEYVNSAEDLPEDIADKCNLGWEYAGRFGKVRYYWAESAAHDGQAHPAKGGRVEIAKLETTITNFNTLLFLNLPGTVYCGIYTFLFMGAGFDIGQIVSVANGRLFFFGLVTGIAAYWFLISRIIMARKRLSLIAEDQK